MTDWLLLLASVSCIAGAALLYLAAPQQQWRAAGPWPARRRLWPGTLCLLASLALLWPTMGPGAAVCAWLLLATLVWTLAPFAGAWRARARAARAGHD